MQPGQRVTVTDVHDNRLLRVVVAVEGDILFVARPEEVDRARSEHREPNCIGFRMSDAKPAKNQK